MPRARRSLFLIVLAVAALIAAAVVWRSPAAAPAGTEPVGLFTTLPILWADNPDIAASLNPDQAPHWARAALERAGPITPLDTLAGFKGHAPLERVRLLVMAQPRVLSPEENVALDQWVRGGGHLLLLADPALTEESAFPITDPRRPQAVVLLSPILARWGLELRIADDGVLGETRPEVMGMAVPVNLPGHFVSEGQGNCRLWTDGLAATCTIGKGKLIALADAAVLEREDPDGARAKAFGWLLEAAVSGR